MSSIIPLGTIERMDPIPIASDPLLYVHQLEMGSIRLTADYQAKRENDVLVKGDVLDITTNGFTIREACHIATTGSLSLSKFYTTAEASNTLYVRKVDLARFQQAQTQEILSSATTLFPLPSQLSLQQDYIRQRTSDNSLYTNLFPNLSVAGGGLYVEGVYVEPMTDRILLKHQTEYPSQNGVFTYKETADSFVFERTLDSRCILADYGTTSTRIHGYLSVPGYTQLFPSPTPSSVNTDVASVEYRWNTISGVVDDYIPTTANNSMVSSLSVVQPSFLSSRDNIMIHGYLSVAIVSAYPYLSMVDTSKNIYTEPGSTIYKVDKVYATLPSPAPSDACYYVSTNKTIYITSGSYIGTQIISPDDYVVETKRTDGRPVYRGSILMDPTIIPPVSGFVWSPYTRSWLLYMDSNEVGPVRPDTTAYTILYTGSNGATLYQTVAPIDDSVLPYFRVHPLWDPTISKCLDKRVFLWTRTPDQLAGVRLTTPLMTYVYTSQTGLSSSTVSLSVGSYLTVSAGSVVNSDTLNTVNRPADYTGWWIDFRKYGFDLDGLTTQTISMIKSGFYVDGALAFEYDHTISPPASLPTRMPCVVVPFNIETAMNTSASTYTNINRMPAGVYQLTYLHIQSVPTVGWFPVSTCSGTIFQGLTFGSNLWMYEERNGEAWVVPNRQPSTGFYRTSSSQATTSPIGDVYLDMALVYGLRQSGTPLQVLLYQQPADRDNNVYTVERNTVSDPTNPFVCCRPTVYNNVKVLYGPTHTYNLGDRTGPEPILVDGGSSELTHLRVALRNGMDSVRRQLLSEVSDQYQYNGYTNHFDITLDPPLQRITAIYPVKGVHGSSYYVYNGDENGGKTWTTNMKYAEDLGKAGYDPMTFFISYRYDFFTQRITFDNELVVNDAIKAHAVSVSQNYYTCGDVSVCHTVFTENLSVQTTIYSNAFLSVHRDIISEGTISVAGVGYVNNLSINGTAYVWDAVSVNNTVYTNQLSVNIFRVGGDLPVGRNITVGGSLSVNQLTYLHDTAVQTTLSVSGPTYLRGGLSVNSSVNVDGTVRATTLSVSGLTYLRNGVSIQGTTYLQGGLSVGSDVITTRPLRSNIISVNQTVYTNQLSVNLFSHVDGTLNVLANTNIGGHLSVYGVVHIFNNVVTTSDERLKTDITPLVHPMDTLRQLTGYTYHRVDAMDPQRLYTGLLAQEVQRCLPSAVYQNGQGYYSVSYNDIIALQVECIKENARRLEQLEERMAELEKKVEP